MNSIFNSLLRALVALTFLILVGGMPAVADEVGLVAESWPLDTATNDAAQRVFELRRSQASATGATTSQLDKLEIPARDNPSLVRVRGVLIPPQTGGYTFNIYGIDDAELWLADDETGEWKLVQSKGNPVTGVGRIKLQQGVAKRFEFWTKGGNEMLVQWESVQWLPAASATAKPVKKVIVAKQSIPASSMKARIAKEGERHGDGLKDGWKQKTGLDLNSEDGPNGPWGDPDGDGLLNWQEQIAGTNPQKADAEGRMGLMRLEVWRNIPGKYVFDLTRSANFPQKPTEFRYLNRLEIPVGNGSDYGSRMRGWIKAPASGEYTFSIIANDTAELWLGNTESFQSKKLIAHVEQDGPQAMWSRRFEQGVKPLFPEQVSAKISLVQGQKYYVEVLHKQGGKEDHCSVGWLMPGATALQVIGGDSLVSWEGDKEDMDDDGLPDAWQQAVGLRAEGINAASSNASADPDHDGFTNWEEWKAGTDPLKADARDTTHMLTSELWDNEQGNRIKDWTARSQYPAKPTHRALIDNMDFSDEGENYACRLRGYLTAPQDGPYLFYISGNDDCILYLADSEDKFVKKVIAQTTSGSGWRSYGGSVSQESGSIELKKGKKYYIEVLFKRGQSAEPQRDHASVAWKRPGRHGLAATVIEADNFNPYRSNTRDLDDDDLPDDWETSHGLDPNVPTGDNGAWGDPDGDLLENFREYQAGLNPMLADVQDTVGFAMWEYWGNIMGGLDVLKAAPSFPLQPTTLLDVHSNANSTGIPTIMM